VDILRNEKTAQQAVASTPTAINPGATNRFNDKPYTTLGKDTEFEGTLRFKEGLRIEGKFNGDISSDGILSIGETGEVTAEIKVGSIIVEGKVTGNIIANDLVELRKTSELRGDITASKLKIEEGVLFVGKSDVQPGNRKSGGISGGNSPKPVPAQPPKQEENK
jgi:cytoskeletal protein CcmA (bactofilin family)